MRYNDPLIKMLETFANMLITSFLWFLFALPIVTIVPSCAALYHTVTKVVFGPGRGNGVFRDFFDSFKTNLIPGIKLTLLLIVAGLFIAEGLWTGFQIRNISLWGTLYMILGILITATVLTAVIYIPPVLSRFIAPLSSILRMAVYFAMKKPLRSLFYLVFFVLLILGVQFFPPALIIVPALYTDLVRTYLERDLQAFIKENELEDIAAEEETEEEETAEEDSAYEMDRKLSRRDGKEKK